MATLYQIASRRHRKVRHAHVGGESEGRPGAGPFIAVRGALRDVHPGVVDVSETWATEGNIALSLVLDEGVDFDTVARSIGRLEGVVVEGTRVVAVSTTDYGIEIDAVPAEPGTDAQ